MGQRKSGWDVEHRVTGTRRAGRARPDPPQRQVVRSAPAQRMDHAGEEPIAHVRGPSSMWFNTTGEFDRWYRRLHPMRQAIARRLGRIDRAQQREREIATIRGLTDARAAELVAIRQSERRNVREREAGAVNPLLEHRERQNALQRESLQDDDPLNQFNRRVRQRFEEAMTREANELADEFSRLDIADPLWPLRAAGPPHRHWEDEQGQWEAYYDMEGNEHHVLAVD